MRQPLRNFSLRELVVESRFCPNIFDLEISKIKLAPGDQTLLTVQTNSGWGTISLTEKKMMTWQENKSTAGEFCRHFIFSFDIFISNIHNLLD